MSKIFTYGKIKNQVNLVDSDEFEDYADEFEYEVEDEDLLNAIIELVNSYYFNNRIKGKDLKNFLRDLDVLDELFDMFEDELKDYFEERAMEEICND